MHSKKLKGGGVQFETLNKIQVLTLIVASEEMHSIDFYSGSRKKTQRGGAILNPKKNQI